MGETSREVMWKTGVDPGLIRGVSFCCQMQGLVVVDSSGRALRPAMSYMDQRGLEQQRKGLRHGLTVEGMNLPKLLTSLRLTGGVSASVKDPLWKYKWVEDEEPEIFSKIHKWLDVKEYLLFRCTGNFVMTHDSANATFLYDTRPGHLGWSRRICRLFGVNPNHLPPVVGSTDSAGPLTPGAAKALGLPREYRCLPGAGISPCSPWGRAVSKRGTPTFI